MARKRKGVEEEEETGEVTRCVCGNDELVEAAARLKGVEAGLFIQCDRCQAWQHGFCVGFRTVKEVPDVYYCEICKPELHIIEMGPFGRSSRYLPHDRKQRGRSARERDSVAQDGDESGGESADDAEPRRSVGAGQPDGEHEDEDQDQDDEDDEGEQHLDGGPHDRLRGRNAKSPEGAASSRAARLEEKKRRSLHSREDAILQRVLEQSALEAQVASRGKKGSPGRRNGARNSRDDVDGHASSGSGDGDGEGDGERNGYTKSKDEKPGSRDGSDSASTNGTPAAGPQGSRFSNGMRAKAEAEADGSDDAEQDTLRGSKRRKPEKIERVDKKPPGRRGGRPPGSKGRAASGASSKRNGNGSGHSGPHAGPGSDAFTLSKRCKPRIPPPRATLPEMRKRITAILEFSGHTQIDMQTEERMREQMLDDQRQKHGNNDAVLQLEDLCGEHKKNIVLLEQLTQKLLAWQEHYG